MNFTGNNVVIINGQVIQSGDSICASGFDKTESRTLSPYESINISTSISMHYEVSENTYFRITAPENVIELITTTVENGTLTISTISSMVLNREIQIIAAGPTLAAAKISGSGNLQIENLNSLKFKGKVSGAANVSATGRAAAVDVSLSGAGKLDLRGLLAEELFLDVSGAGNVCATATKSAQIDVSGAATVMVYGNPSQRNVDRSGAALVTFL